MKLLFFLVVLFGVVYSQSLSGIVLSVTTYATCAISPLNQLPLSQGSSSNNFTNPCEQYGYDQNVTAVRVLIRPNRAGASKLVFNLYHTTNSSTAGSYDYNKNCSGTASGANCIVLTNPLVLSFDSTALYAQYELLRRKYASPYAYAVLVNDNVNLPSTAAKNSFSYVETVDCSGLTVNNDVWQIGFKPTGNSQTGTQSCPSTLTSNGKVSVENQFYDPPGSTYVSEAGYSMPYLGTSIANNDACTVLMCQSPIAPQLFQPQAYFGIVTRGLEPLCTIFDIVQRPTGLMNIRLIATTANSTQTVIMSTTNGGSLQAIPGILSAKINTIDTGIGQIGRVIPGVIVTCNTCDNDNSGNVNCELGLVNDMAGVVAANDTFTIINPWTNQTSTPGTQGTPGIEHLVNCNLPASICRRNIGGLPSAASWYYIPPELNFVVGTGCNQNGMEATIYNQPDIQARVCNAILGCSSNVVNFTSNGCDYLAGMCVPGFPQQSSGGLTLGQNVVFTFCEISQIWARFLAQYTGVANSGTYNFNDGYFWMPPGYDPASNPFFIVNQKLLTLALGGDSSEVSVDITVYVSGSFIAQVNVVAPGEFIAQGQACTSASQDAGALTYSVKNTGATVGNYLISATAILPAGNTPNTFTFEGVGVGNLTSVETLEIPAGGIGSGAFDYTYTGTTGSSMTILLVLSIPAGNGQFTVIEQETVTCTTVGGEVFIDNLQQNVSSTVYVNPPAPCAWWQIFTCWSGLNWFALLIRIFILCTFILFYGTVLVVLIIAIVCTCRLCFEKQRLKNVSKKG